MTKIKTFALASFLAFAAVSNAATYAVVIGINDYDSPTDATGNPIKDERGNPVQLKLRGAVNDAVGVADLLKVKYNISDSKMLVLTDKMSNAQGFTTALKATFGVLSPGDQFVFYFSGHGSRIPVDGSKDADGKGSAIVLSDLTLVRGDLFGSIANKLKSAGISSTFMFDSCFAGGMSRDSNIYGFRGARKKTLDAKKVRAKAISAASFKSLETVSDLKTKMVEQSPTQMAAEFAFIFASQNDVVSIDLPKRDNSPAHGLFTLAALAVLRDQPTAASGEFVFAIKQFFDETFKNSDIKQRPTDEYSSAERAKAPVFIKG